MNSDFEDPNNSAPDVTPDDGWGDDATGESPSSIPSKRIPEKKTSRKPESDAPSFTVREVVPSEEGPPKKKNPVPTDDQETLDGQETISSPYEDPDNHVPRLTAVDDWGSEQGSSIPQRRAQDERPAGYAAKPEDADEKGVDIGVRVIERAQDQEVRGPVQRLEVLEHVAKSAAATGEALPKVVPKQVIEKQELSEEEIAEGAWHGRVPESESWGKQRAIPVRWMVISGVALAVAVIAGVLALPHFGWKNEQGVSTHFGDLEVFDPPMLEVKGGDLKELGEGIEEKARSLVEAFVKANSADEVLPLVRNRERLESAIRERWTKKNVSPTWRLPDESGWEILRIGNQEYGFLTGSYPDITPYRFYIVQEGEEALLDWEASTGYSETTFGDLLKGKGEGGIVRGFVSPGDLYTFSLPETDYQCFRIVSSDAESIVWGYVKRSEPVAEKLTEQFVPGVIPREVLSEYMMTLKLSKAPGESLPNQWIITEMLHLDWLTP